MTVAFARTAEGLASEDALIAQKLEQAQPQPPLSSLEAVACKARIRQLLAQRNAVLIAHYYTDTDIQSLAEESGGCVADSLEMARFGRDHPATTLVVCGVRFMGETAKILSPDKRVLMPSLEATCSLDLGCPAAPFADFCAAHPEREVVVYANTSAAVKACSDWVVTSTIALEVVEFLHGEGRKILWAPDRHLGDYIQRHTGADMVIWQGACIVHEEFKARGIRELLKVYPEAAVLAHPEAPQAVLELADHIGSTTQIIQAASRMERQCFIVATDRGLVSRLRLQFPAKEFLLAPTAGHGATCRSCGHCPWMAMNGLRSLEQCLSREHNEVLVDEELIPRAVRPLQRMLDFAAGRR